MISRFPIHLAAFVSVVVLNLVVPVRAQEVERVVSSNAGDRLSAKPALHMTASFGAKSTFRIDPSTRLQTMDGFGASMLEAGIICINSLPAEKQEAVLKRIFDVGEGAGFSAMKTTIAGTDFMSTGPYYTYDEKPGDTELKSFSIARDLRPNGMVTFIKRARKYGQFALQAPMDYPPDWMLFDVAKKQDVDPKYFDALAHYYLRYVQEYEKNGISIDYVSLFNEPGIYTKISYQKIRDLLRDHVGPLFESEHVKARIQPSEPNTRINAWKGIPVILNDPRARKYVANLAYHGYDYKDYDKIADLHRRYPDLHLWMTEVCHAYESGTPRSMKLPRLDFADGEHWGNVLFSDIEAGASAWIYWNLILDEKGGPWCVSVIHGNPDPNVQHPVVVINRTTGEVIYTGLYYYLAHFSKYVRPGAVRIGTSGKMEGVRVVSFQRPDGGIVCQLMNSRKAPASVSLEWKERTAATELPRRSITTLQWKGE